MKKPFFTWTLKLTLFDYFSKNKHDAKKDANKSVTRNDVHNLHWSKCRLKKIGGGLKGLPPNSNMQMRFLEYQSIFTIKIKP